MSQSPSRPLDPEARDARSDERAAAVRFDDLAGDLGVEVVDPIDRHRYGLYTDDPVDQTPAGTGGFRYPVDAATTFETTGISLPNVVVVNVRDDEGEVLASLEHLADERLGPGRYTLELLTPVKLYLQVEGPVAVTADLARTRIEFDRPRRVTVGARSRHERPAATVTTTSDPRDLMAAVSTFGSALKTTAPERSYPTLRGHPPAIEVGDRLEIPAGLEPPETGLRIEVPPRREAVYVVASLAYYLGARVVPGEVPRLVADDHDLDYRLDGPAGFERTVERVLKQTFFLDCLIRAEGEYGSALNERNAVEPAVDLDFPATYAASLPEQVDAYLQVPYETVEPHLPDWKLTTHVTPDASSAETLPFLVNDLAVVRSPRAEPTTASAEQSSVIGAFLRSASEFTRSTADAGTPSASANEFVSPEATDSLEQAWVGEETPFGASKVTAAAYHHRLDRTPKQGDIDITVVCNDPEMAAEEGVVDDAYGTRENLPFDLTLRRELTVEQLRATLETETDFLHYIGHIDEEGFRCTDGSLDARELETVGVDAFLLNACSSYAQGMALVDVGSIGGVVTLADVINSGAVNIGKAVARLLNRGFPLNAALEVARGESVVGSQYIVVGDGGLAITQAESGSPVLFEIERVEDGGGEEFDVHFHAYPTSRFGLGSEFSPFIDEATGTYLNSGKVDTFRLGREECQRFLERENVPTRVDGALRWSYDLDLSRF